MHIPSIRLCEVMSQEFEYDNEVEERMSAVGVTIGIWYTNRRLVVKYKGGECMRS